MATQEILYDIAKHFDADFERGLLYRVKSDGTKKPAGCFKRHLNRHYVIFRKKTYLRYRIIFALYHGYWPKNEIDHIDGCSNNDSIANLRDCDRALNAKNCKLRSDNTSGHVGVTFEHQIKRWRVRLGHIHLGVFERFEDAVQCRIIAALENAYTERHGT